MDDEASSLEEHYRTADGRGARVAWEDGVLSVHIEWSGDVEQWQTMASATQGKTTLETYDRTLRAAGFHRLIEGADCGSVPQLSPDAVWAVAEALGPIRPALRPVIEAGLAVRHDVLRAACREARAARIRHHDLFEDHEQAEVVAFGGGRYVWTYDDDRQLGPRPDPLPEGLAAQLARRMPERLHVQLFGALGPWKALLGRYESGPVMTHLIVSTASVVDEQPPPGLLALTGCPRTLGPWLRQVSTVADVEALTLLGAPDSWEAIAALPSLRNLGIWCGGPDAERVLRQAPAELIARLATLDLFGVEGARSFPFHLLLEGRSRFEHMSQIFLGGHLVPSEARAQFSDWSQVLFVSHDRLETLAHDLRCIGFPSAHR